MFDVTEDIYLFALSPFKQFYCALRLIHLPYNPEFWRRIEKLFFENALEDEKKLIRRCPLPAK